MLNNLSHFHSSPFVTSHHHAGTPSVMTSDTDTRGSSVQSLCVDVTDRNESHPRYITAVALGWSAEDRDAGLALQR